MRWRDGPLERDAAGFLRRRGISSSSWCSGARGHVAAGMRGDTRRCGGRPASRGVLAVAERRGRVTVFGAPPAAPAVAGRARRARAPLPARLGLRRTAEAGGVPGQHRAGTHCQEALLAAVRGRDSRRSISRRPPRTGARYRTTPRRQGSPPQASDACGCSRRSARYLDQRRRATLFPDPELRARARTGIGNAGRGAGGRSACAGLWRPGEEGEAPAGEGRAGHGCRLRRGRKPGIAARSRPSRRRASGLLGGRRRLGLAVTSGVKPRSSSAHRNAAQAPWWTRAS